LKSICTWQDSRQESQKPKSNKKELYRLEDEKVIEDMLYTVQETAKLIKTNPAYVYSLIKAGLLPVLKLGSYKIRKVALLEFLVKYEGYDLTDPDNVHKLKLDKDI